MGPLSKPTRFMARILRKLRRLRSAISFQGSSCLHAETLRSSRFSVAVNVLWDSRGCRQGCLRKRNLWRGSLRLVLFMALFIAACTTTPPQDVVLQELHQRAERRLIQEARALVVQRRYNEAIAVLQRFLDTHSRSSVLPEARWWLARSYHATGKTLQALVQYRLLTQQHQDEAYAREARLRIAEIEAQLGAVSAPHHPVTGVLLTIDQLQVPLHKTLHDWMAAFNNGKPRVLLVDFPCRHLEPQRKISRSPLRIPQTIAWKTVVEQHLKPFVKRMRAWEGVVYVAVTPRCLGTYGLVTVSAEWHDRIFHPATNTLRPSPFFSLSFPPYQDLVATRLEDLVKTGIAGILFRAGAPLGPYEGFHPASLQEFTRVFGEPLNPVHLFTGRESQTEEGRRERPFSWKTARVSPLFWRWTGWKARSRLQILSDLLQRLREQQPSLRAGLEVHPESVVHPVQGLARYSEDWIAATHKGFDFFVLDWTPSRRAVAIQTGGRIRPPALAQAALEQMIQYLRNPRRIWVILPRESALHPNRSAGLDELMALPRDVGRIVTFPALP
ncbi:MAG: hypothetical protein D6704_07560 [Nitrospirae bacterium]|nr:MAG: hypothetical protein D6704_07560 [Nitrospirota bacterium]